MQPISNASSSSSPNEDLIDNNVCRVCGMRKLMVNGVEKYESYWCRVGNGRLLTRPEVIEKVCSNASVPGCIATDVVITT